MSAWPQTLVVDGKFELSIDETSCFNCRFWLTELNQLGLKVKLSNTYGEGVGECHANPPMASGVWPRTIANEWCGRFQAK